MYDPMELIKIYQCLCDQTRLRIINLLNQGPLCVCHFQEALGESQVKISKHLAYLRAHELVVAKREANWMIYRLPEKPSKELSANLACLQDCARDNKIFLRDISRLDRLRNKLVGDAPLCCATQQVVAKAKTK